MTRQSWIASARRWRLVLASATLVTLAVMVVNIGVGEYPVAPLDVIKTVLHIPTGDARHDFVVNVLRLPRMLVAALVGMALGVSGAILQGLTRNPLASPGILGINAGAGLVAATLIVVVTATRPSA
jgi:iron complex transport system permease protein